MAADTVGDMVNTFIGHEVDKSIDDAEQDATEKSQMTSQEFYNKGTDQLGSTYEAYLKENTKLGDSTDFRDWTQDLENGYDLGSSQNDYRGRAPYKG